MKVLMVLAIAGGIFYFIGGADLISGLDNDGISENGFIELPKLSNIKTDSVIIFAPKNCSKESARRADEIAYQLEKRNISVVRASHASFEGFDPSMQGKIEKVMRGTIPIVFVDGWGKANPTFDEIVAEYNLVYE